MSEPSNKTETSPRAMILVIDDEPLMCRVLEKTLRMERYDVAAFTQPREALAALGEIKPDLALTDLLMPGIDGMGVLEAIRRYDASIPTIIITAHGSIEGAVTAIKAGAFNYVTKPFLTDELLLMISQALEVRRLRDERASVDELWRRTQARDQPVGASEGWRAVMAMVEKIAPAPGAVLIEGETGVGKEVVARALHGRSRNARGRFVPINCAAIPETLIESELFGYEKGAFTGAAARKLGLIELASHGTLFLDEIGELPLAMQAKLLRALEDHKIQRLGGTREITVDTRVIAATNRDLKQQIADGHFREDLYYRLNVLTVRIPALRDRRADVPRLAAHFVGEICADLGRRPPGLTSAALATLEAYDWPGNARELRNVLERTLALFRGGDMIDVGDLPPDLARAVPPAPNSTAGAPSDGLSYQEARDRFDREFVTALLRGVGGNVTAAAKAAQMSRRNLYEKIEKLSIAPGTFKGGDDKNAE